MNNVNDNVNCYGCGICSVACPRQIIKLIHNGRGFYIPQVENEECIECGICLSCCSYIDDLVSDEHCANIKSFASWSLDEKIRFQCSSGGSGYAIAQHLLSLGYKICAVRYDVNKRRAEHYIATNEQELIESVGSKYIQSYTSDGLSNIDWNDKYLVVGTPCMIDSFRKLIRKKKKESNFILMDFFCHGVPSRLLWEKYNNIKIKECGDIKAIKWRNKNDGWQDSLKFLINGTKKKYIGGINQGDIFYKLFLGDYCLGDACYNKCKYKMLKSAADIRIGDLWGKTYMNNKKGVSGLLTFNDEAYQIISKIPGLFLQKEDISVVTEGQMLQSPSEPLLRPIILKLLSMNSSSMFMEHLIVSIDKKIKKIIKLIFHPNVVLKNRFYEKGRDYNNA